ncbi:MAG: hypothetical protein K2Y71_27690 [Xanthobacteraceae bacterium]|nr:hypothetical protein [Xanthobacteraceae bacterium]
MREALPVVAAALQTALSFTTRAALCVGTEVWLSDPSCRWFDSARRPTGLGALFEAAVRFKKPHQRVWN